MRSFPRLLPRSRRLAGLALILLSAAVSRAAETSGALNPAAILARMEHVADWQLAHPAHARATDWTQAAGDAGFMALAGISANPRYLAAMRAMGEQTGWKSGPRTYDADDYCIGQTYAELYARFGEDRMIAPLRAQLDHLMAHPAGDSLDFRGPDKKRAWSWCDSLFMGPPTFARLYAATGDRRYLDFMDHRWWRTCAYLCDRGEHLFYRDDTFFDRREANGQKIFWSRGNGWVIAGLVRVLQCLPNNYPDRPRYEALFRAMADKLRTLQGPDGLWRASLLDAGAYPQPETSGTGLIGYALAWGVNQGLLDRAVFEPAALAAWAGLLRHVNADGRLGSVQPVGAAPALLSENDTHVYGTGAFLLAGSEIFRLALLQSQPHAAVTAANPLDRYRRALPVELTAAALRALPGNFAPDDLLVMDAATSRLLGTRVISATGAAPALLFQTDIAPLASRRFLLIARPAGFTGPAPIGQLRAERGPNPLVITPGAD